MKKVAVIMGSDSDWPVVQGACAQLKEFGIPYEAHILSAHRTPAAAAEFARGARANGFGVLICAAGMARPPGGGLRWELHPARHRYPHEGGAMDGLDALLATVQMPSGIPVATVAINGVRTPLCWPPRSFPSPTMCWPPSWTPPGEDGGADRRQGGQAPGRALIQTGNRSDGARCARILGTPAPLFNSYLKQVSASRSTRFLRKRKDGLL